MSRLELQRFDDRNPPLRELLAIDHDGSFRMWRSNSDVVGRFAGRVPDPDALAMLVERAATSPRPADVAPPVADAAQDVLRVSDQVMTTTPSRQPDGPWGELLIRSRALMDDLRDQPSAAIALELIAPDAIRLVQRGTSVLLVELGSMAVEIEVYGNVDRLAAGTAEVPELHHVDAGPGWSIDLAIPVLEVPSGATRLVTVGFVALDDGIFVPMTLTASDPQG